MKYLFSICEILITNKNNPMTLLAAQIANNSLNESPLMIIGVTACIISIVLLLWKNEAKTTI